MKAYFVRLDLSMMGRREEKRTRSFTPLGNITHKFNARLLAGGVAGDDDVSQHLELFDSGELEQVVNYVVWD
ncbi:hypothetical protein HZH68_011512 [Vespula germanica]|uniref:Uncharacterized protein n=1 Tax=Vespula germanica TaxID=30212 RepID=A0A834N1W0_VESGE|nr:hypothetical protein HZH68_011512 [Vespula germanica]